MASAPQLVVRNMSFMASDLKKNTSSPTEVRETTRQQLEAITRLDLHRRKWRERKFEIGWVRITNKRNIKVSQLVRKWSYMARYEYFSAHLATRDEKNRKKNTTSKQQRQLTRSESYIHNFVVRSHLPCSLNRRRKEANPKIYISNFRSISKLLNIDALCPIYISYRRYIISQSCQPFGLCSNSPRVYLGVMIWVCSCRWIRIFSRSRRFISGIRMISFSYSTRKDGLGTGA